MPTRATTIPVEPVEVDEPIAAEETAEATTADRVLNLTIELHQLKKDKKESNKTYNEEIKRVEAEIKDLLDKEEGEKENE